MSFSDHINSVSKSCHFHIRDIRRIRHLLSLSTATALDNSLVSSKLDYCNSLYSGHLTKKSQPTSTHSKFIGTCHYKYFKISTHHTNTQKTTLASYQTKNRLQTLSSHIHFKPLSPHELSLGLMGPGLGGLDLGLVGLDLSLMGHGLGLLGLWPR